MASAAPTPGELRERITLQVETDTRDQVGGRVVTWSDQASLWAEIRPASAREAWQRSQMQASAAWTVVLRWRTDITVRNRIKWRGRYFMIRGVTNEDQRHRYLTLACDELNVTGQGVGQPQYPGANASNNSYVAVGIV